MKEETKEKAKNFMSKVKSALDKGFGASKRALGIAGDAVQDFSDKTATRIEKSQLESKLKKQFEALGEFVNNALTSKRKIDVSAKNKDIANYLKEIARLKNEIAIRLDSLENDSKKVVVTKKPATTKTTTSKVATKKASTSKTTSAKVAPKKTSSSKASSVKATAKKVTSASKKTSSKK